MKTLPNQTASDSALDKRNFNTTKFSGTDNPRHLRAIHALLTRPMPREHLDRHVGCSNSPDVIAELRRRGLDVPCERVPDTDRDGKLIKRGVYHFIAQDRSKISRWLALRRQEVM
jgi:hypothetical protein